MTNGVSTMASSFIEVMRNDAQEALSSREILLAMHRRARELKVGGTHEAAQLFNSISIGLTTSGLMALARLHDTGKDAISIPKAGRNQALNQPTDLRELKKNLSQTIAKNISEWRTNLYAHSLQKQLSTSIDQNFPLVNAELDDFIQTSCTIVNSYSEHNREGSSWPVIISDSKTQEQAAQLVEKLFSL